MLLTSTERQLLAAKFATVESMLITKAGDKKTTAIEWRTIFAQILQEIGPILLTILVSFLLEPDKENEV